MTKATSLIILGSAVLCTAPVMALGQAQNVLPGAIHDSPTNVRASLKTIATGLVSPVYGTTAPGDPNDLYVVDQAGTIDVLNLHSGSVITDPTSHMLINETALEAQVPLKSFYDERGVLGLAFSPGFADPASPGYHTLYTYQSEKTGTAPANFAPAPGTVTSGIDHQNVLVQWKVSASDPTVVDMSSRRDLLREDHPALNHNGGTVAFGPDGDLYLAIGDGGTANDQGNGHLPTGNAQALNVIMGKMIRIDPDLDHTSEQLSANGQYRIPSDNPFINTPGALPEIYSYGHRNPYRFSFDSATGDLIEGEAGQNQVEEVNKIVKGGNYGWDFKEGTFQFIRTGPNAGTVIPTSIAGTPTSFPAGTTVAPDGTVLIDPVLEYDHNDGSAAIGGFVYHGSLLPQLDGMYIFGDLNNNPFTGPGNGRLFYADLSTGQINEFNLTQTLGSQSLFLKGFGQDANGEIYVMASTALGPSGTTGVVFELVPEPASLALLALLALLPLCQRPRARSMGVLAHAF